MDMELCDGAFSTTGLSTFYFVELTQDGNPSRNNFGVNKEAFFVFFLF